MSKHPQISSFEKKGCNNSQMLKHRPMGKERGKVRISGSIFHDSTKAFARKIMLPLTKDYH